MTRHHRVPRRALAHGGCPDGRERAEHLTAPVPSPDATTPLDATEIYDPRTPYWKEEPWIPSPRRLPS